MSVNKAKRVEFRVLAARRRCCSHRWRDEVSLSDGESHVKRRSVPRAKTAQCMDHDIGHRVALRSGVLGVGADIEVEPGSVDEEDVARPTPGDDPTKEVAGYLVGAEPALTS